MKTYEQRREDLKQTYDFTTQAEFNDFLKNADTNEMCNIVNEICDTIHCCITVYNRWFNDDDYGNDLDLRCFRECNWKRYEITIADQLFADEIDIVDLIEDIMQYEEEAKLLALVEIKDV